MSLKTKKQTYQYMYNYCIENARERHFDNSKNSMAIPAERHYRLLNHYQASQFRLAALKFLRALK